MNGNAELCFLVDCWEELSPGAKADIMTTLLIAQVRKLPAHLQDEVVKHIKPGSELPKEKRRARPS
jgi:hypothetical protein